MKNFYAILALVTTTMVSYAQTTWTKLTNHTDVTATGTYMIVDVTSSKAITSANGSGSAPTAVSVTISNNTISGNIEENLQWTFEASGEGYIIRPKYNNTISLTNTNTNNGVRVNTGTSNIWVLNISVGSYKGFQTPSVNNRYLGVYNNQDWRTYTGVTGSSNIANTQIEIFQLVEEETPVEPVTPTASFEFSSLDNFTYDFGATTSDSQDITLTVTNLTDDYNLSLVSTNDYFEIVNPTALVNGENTITIKMTQGLAVGTYTGSVQVTLGEMELDTVILSGEVTDSSLGNSKNEIEGLRIYPNPANDIVMISSNTMAVKSVQLFDMVGKEVMNVETSSSINVSSLTKGIYVMKVTEEGKTSTSKLIIK